MFEQLKNDLDKLSAGADPEIAYEGCMEDYFNLLSAFAEWKSDSCDPGCCRSESSQRIIKMQRDFFEDRIKMFQNELVLFQTELFEYHMQDWLVGKWKQDIAMLEAVCDFYGKDVS